MSTLSSGPDPAAATKSLPKRIRWFRWKGIVPIALLGIIVGFGWKFFGARLIRSGMEAAGTAVLGSQVDVAGVAIHFFPPSVDVRGVAVADNDNLARNRLEVGRAAIRIEALPLFRKKLIVTSVRVTDVQTGSARAVPARKVLSDTGSAVFKEVRGIASRVRVPVMSLVPLDSIKSVVLNPQDLKAAQAAIALGRATDSVKQAVDRSFSTLSLQPAIDSSTALIARLQGTNLRTLGLEGARTALADIRRTTAQVDSAKSRVERMVVDTKRGVDSLQAMLGAVDAARREDYASARSLLKLPSFDAPEIGAAIFGDMTMDRYQQALKYAMLARKYAPPGLMPRESPGPKRARMAGTTVHFVKQASLPRFLLRRADLSFTGQGAAAVDYAAAASDITSDPAITGKPMLFVARRVARASGDSIRISGSLDHTTATSRDVVSAYMSGVALPKFAMPMLPYWLDPGKGVAELRLRLEGERLSGSWSVRSTAVAWVPDPARSRSLNSMETLVARALTGVRELQLATEIGGTLQSPTLSVRSNIDRVVAERLRSVAGEEIAAAQARLRSQVDRLVDEKLEPVKAKVNALRADSERRISEARTRLDDEKKKLEDRLKAIGGGVNLPRLPGRPPA